MKKEINKLEEEITDLTDVNKELADYIEALEQRESLKCQRKKVTEVGTKQKGRKLRHLKYKVQCALWFCKSFGLEITQVKLQDKKEVPTLWTGNQPLQMEIMKIYIKRTRTNLSKFLLDKYLCG